MDSTPSFTQPSLIASVSAPPLTLAESTSTTSVTTKEVSSPASERRKQYIQSRIERRHREREAVRNKLEQAEKELDDTRSRKSKMCLTLMSENQTLLAEKKGLEEIKEKIRQAQELYKSKHKAVVLAQGSVNELTGAIKKAEESIRDRNDNILQLKKQLEDGLESKTAQVTRQADILDMSPSEIEAMATHAANNRAFSDKIARAAKDTATSVMIREIQSEMFSRMTGITPKEFRDLAKRIQSTMGELFHQDMRDDTDNDDDEDDNDDDDDYKSEKSESDCDRIQDSKEGGRDSVDPEESDSDHSIIRPGRRRANESYSRRLRRKRLRQRRRTAGRGLKY